MNGIVHLCVWFLLLNVMPVRLIYDLCHSSFFFCVSSILLHEYKITYSLGGYLNNFQFLTVTNKTPVHIFVHVFWQTYVLINISLEYKPRIWNGKFRYVCTLLQKILSDSSRKQLLQSILPQRMSISVTLHPWQCLILIFFLKFSHFDMCVVVLLF